MNPKILLAFVGGAALAGVITMFVASGPAPAPAPRPEPAPVVETAAAAEVPKDIPVEEVRPSPWPKVPERVKQASRPVAKSVANPVAKPMSKPTAPKDVAQTTPAPQPAQQPVSLPPFSTEASAPAPSHSPEPKREEPKRTEIFKPEPPKAPERKPETVTIPAGTTVSVRLNSTLSSETSAAGDTFTAVLDQPLVVNDMVIAERGARVDGKVVEAVKAGRVKGTSMLSVALTRVRTSDGQNVAIATDPFVREGESSKKADAVKVGVGAAIGAAIGAIAGGGKGAAIGGASGGAAGGGVVLATRGKPVQIDVESKLPFRLAQAVTVTEKIR